MKHFILFILGFYLSLFLVWSIDRTGTFKWIGIDPAISKKWQPRHTEKPPLFYAQPSVPTGLYYKRRTPKQVQTGNVLKNGAEMAGYFDHPYHNISEVRIDYGKYGFRGPYPKSKGYVALMGGSYTEAGYVNYSDNWEGLLTEKYGYEASNFGVSFVGGFTQLHYLKQFVLPTKPAQIIWIFSENWDFFKLVEESVLIHNYHSQTPQLPNHFTQLAPEPIRFLQAGMGRMISVFRGWGAPFHVSKNSKMWSAPPHAPQRLYRLKGFDQKTHLTFPPSPENFNRAKPILKRVLQEMKRLCDENSVQFGLLYVPSSANFLDDFLENRTVRRSLDYDSFYEFVRKESQAQGITTVNAKDVLIEEVRNQRIPINPIFDLHLNQDGIKTVTALLAKKLISQR